LRVESELRTGAGSILHRNGVAVGVVNRAGGVAVLVGGCADASLRVSREGGLVALAVDHLYKVVGEVVNVRYGVAGGR